MVDDKITIVASKTNIIITSVACILIVGLFVVGYFAWKNIQEENDQLKTQVTEFQKLTNDFVRSSNQWATKDDLKDQLKNVLTKEELAILNKDMDKLGSDLMAVGVTTGRIEKRITKLEKSTTEIPDTDTGDVVICEGDGRPIDVQGYTLATQVKEVIDSNEAPIAKVQFDASNPKPWGYEVYGKEFKLTTVIGKEDSGQLTYYHKLTYTVPDKDKKKEYPVAIISSNYQQTQLTNKMFWLNPILDVGIFVGGQVYQFAPGPGRDSVLSTGVDLGISLSSYGETRADSWVRFFRFGVGFNMERQAAQFSIAPLTFNIGKPLPLITNLYVMPLFAIDTAGGMTLNLGLGLQL